MVPTTPLLLPGLPGRPHPAVKALTGPIARVLQGHHDADVVVLVTGGSALAVSDGPSTDLGGYGLSSLPAHPIRPGPPEVVAALRRCTAGCGGNPVADGPPADLRVLARHLAAGTTAVGLAVPPLTPPEVSDCLGEAIVRAADRHAVMLVVAGDLGAGHGDKPPRPAAAAASECLDQRVVAALDNGRPADLAALDTELTTQARSRAAGALRVLGTVLDLVHMGTVVRALAAPLGVGYVVAGG